MAVLAGDCRIADDDHDSNELDDNDDAEWPVGFGRLKTTSFFHHIID